MAAAAAEAASNIVSPMSTSTGGNFEAEFMQLVDLYLSENPTQTAALAHCSCKVCCGQGSQAYKSGQGAKVNWPGRDAERLAAIFLVLYREESLRRPGKRRRKEILGLSLIELYDMIARICRTTVSREALSTALREDLEGTTTQLVQARKMEALWRVPETRSAYDAIVASKEVVREQGPQQSARQGAERPAGARTREREIHHRVCLRAADDVGRSVRVVVVRGRDAARPDVCTPPPQFHSARHGHGDGHRHLP